MTKEITKAYILQQIQDKFGLREYEAEKFLFSELVTPTYDIERHLTTVTRGFADISIPSGPSPREFFLVPSNERWHLHGYNVIFVTGVFTIAGVMIGRHTSAEYFYLDLAAAQNTSYTHLLSQDIILNPGDRLLVYIDGYTSSGNLHMIIDYTKESIR